MKKNINGKLKIELLFELRDVVNKYDFEGDINEVSKNIKNIPVKAKKMYPLNEYLQSSHRFSIRQDTECDYGNTDQHDIYILQCYRWETDNEYVCRIELNKKHKILAKERNKRKEEGRVKREKTLYENLKKKFDK